MGEPEQPAKAVTARARRMLTAVATYQRSSDLQVGKNFAENPHTRLAMEHGGTGATCESCHGPGKAHVDGGGDVSKIFRSAGREKFRRESAHQVGDGAWGNRSNLRKLSRPGQGAC